MLGLSTTVEVGSFRVAVGAPQMVRVIAAFNSFLVSDLGNDIFVEVDVFAALAHVVSTLAE